MQPVCLTRREIVILHAETWVLPHDPLITVHNARVAMGLMRTFTLLNEAITRRLIRRSWGWTKPSHTGPHQYPDCCDPEICDKPGAEKCSRYDRKYWRKHPEMAGFDVFAWDDAMSDALWQKEFANPRYPLPAGVFAPDIPGVF